MGESLHFTSRNVSSLLGSKVGQSDWLVGASPGALPTQERDCRLDSLGREQGRRDSGHLPNPTPRERVPSRDEQIIRHHRETDHNEIFSYEDELLPYLGWILEDRFQSCFSDCLGPVRE
jgi:hypothetical protein